MDRQFVITIARGYGSGGRTIGKMLAQELGVDFYDRKLLRLASDESGINEALFGRADETFKGTLLFKVARKNYNGEIISPDSDDFISNENLFNYQAKVIKELAERESCIIIGRCANWILQDNPNVLRIYIHAPLEVCVQRVMEIDGLDERQARKKVQTIDKRRAAYYQYFTGQDWKNADHYDLCLNSHDLSWDQCVKLVKEYLNIHFSL